MSFVPSVVCSTASIKPDSATRLEDLNGTVLYGTPTGVYRGALGMPSCVPTKLLGLVDVTQIDVLEDHQLLLVLSERRLLAFPLSVLDSPHDPVGNVVRGERVSSRVSFVRVGRAFGSTGICIVKSSSLSGTVIKVMTPRPIPLAEGVEQEDGTRSFKKFKDAAFPVETRSVHMLGSNLCVGTSKGFELVDLESDNLATQPLLDPSDSNLDFAREQKRRFKIGRTLVNWPISISHCQAGYLLCYNMFAFYVDIDGKRVRPDFLIHWDDWVTDTALQYPYVLAFSPTKVQVWHVEMGSKVQDIDGTDVRLLYAKPLKVGALPGPSSTASLDAELLIRTNDTVVALQM